LAARGLRLARSMVKTTNRVRFLLSATATTRYDTNKWKLIYLFTYLWTEMSENASVSSGVNPSQKPKKFNKKGKGKGSAGDVMLTLTTKNKIDIV
jgi:hypothetical protein